VELPHSVAILVRRSRNAILTIPPREVVYPIAAAFLALFLSVVYRARVPDAVNDLWFPLCGAYALLNGVDPYRSACVPVGYASNPLTTILVVLPFEPLWFLGTMLLWSLGVGLLAYGALKKGGRWPLLIFTSASFWNAFLTLQWSPLLTAITLLPSLLPLALVKPNVGLPTILTNLTPRRILACGAFLLLTFIVDPLWVLKWLPQTAAYDGFIPLLILPLGPLLLLSLIRWRDPRVRFFFLMSLVPQRGFYDALLLWVLPDSPRQLVLLSATSWIGFIGAFSFHLNAPLLVLLTIYFPMLAMILASSRRKESSELSPS
jgi:hypothetical protein